MQQKIKELCIFQVIKKLIIILQPDIFLMRQHNIQKLLFKSYLDLMILPNYN